MEEVDKTFGVDYLERLLWWLAPPVVAMVAAIAIAWTAFHG